MDKARLLAKKPSKSKGKTLSHTGSLDIIAHLKGRLKTLLSLFSPATRRFYCSRLVLTNIA